MIQSVSRCVVRGVLSMSSLPSSQLLQLIHRRDYTCLPRYQSFDSFHRVESNIHKMSHLFINPLQTIRAFLGILDNRIMRQKRINMCQPVERKAHQDKRHHLVDKRAVGHDNGSIGLRLMQRVVAPGG